MRLKHLRQSKRIISSFLVTSIITELIYPLQGQASTNRLLSTGSGTPVSASVSSMVDGYTGDFRYSVPLVNVPGPNGESVPVTVNYHAGIQVNQSSSWIGLGWDYNPGEISRQVVDAPDDYNGLFTSENGGLVAKFGALYYKNLNNIDGSISYIYNKSADVKTVFRSITDNERDRIINRIESPNPNVNSGYNYLLTQDGDKWKRDATVNYRFRKHMSPHRSIAYDNYAVSGAISGNLKLFALGETKLYSGIYYKTTNNLNLSNNRKPNFYFEGSTTSNVDLTNYTNSNIVNSSTNQIHSGTFVKYFTNAEINKNSNLFDNATGVGFLEYKATTNSGTTTSRRTEQADLIGAFQITDNSGITYHYALPVYSFSDINYNWTIGGGTENGCMKIDKYASSWKLTAITGQDYQDLNHNYTVDEGDAGYWVAYNYSLWATDYMWSSLRYGYATDHSITTKYNSFATTGYMGNRYARSGSIANGHSEKYYLNYIKTATHTAFFVKSVRMDEQSYNPNPTDYMFKPVPLLKLDKVVLMNNADQSCLINNTSFSSSDKDSRFSYTYCNNALNDINFINKSRYDANETNIKAKALKIIELESDYCLAKNYSGNINNTFSNIAYHKTSVVNSTAVNVYSKTFSSSTAPTNNGKLTLKKIKYYDLGGVKITPSIDFGYDESNSLKNPNYNGDKTDWWGYYKNDYSGSHFVTASSKNDVDAWSLKQINTSLGGQINIQYESDRYHKEGFYDEPSFKPLPCIFNNNNLYRSSGNAAISLNKPHLIFPMQSVSYTNSSSISNITSYTLWDSDSPSNTVDKTFVIYNFESTFNSSSTGSVKQLVRKGNENGSAVLNGTYPYWDYQEFDIPEGMYHGGQISGSSYHSYLTNGYGVNYKLCFSSFLYGGGIRVKQIDVVDPFKNDTYTQKFTYGNGYCPVVPNALELASSNGPSAYDIVMSTKSLVNSSANSNVGYDSMTQASYNQNGSSNGSVVQTYCNELIDPFSTVQNGSAFGNGIGGGKAFKPDAQCNPSNPTGCEAPGTDPHNGLHFYTFYLNLSISDYTGKQLGLLLKTSVLNSNNIEVSKTQYIYGLNTITEKFKLDESVIDNFSFLHTWRLPDNLKCNNPSYTNAYNSLKRYTVSCFDTYIYDFSLVQNNAFYLAGTTTTKDGISISEAIVERDPYTTAPTKVIVNDPTQGVFETRTTYAYKNTSAYPAIGLKTQNESNRNLLGLSENVRTIKNQKYVINESYVTYSNSYPTRSYNSGAGKYVTSSVTHPWYRLNESYSRSLDDDILVTATPQSSDYRKTSEGTLYDTENNRIEEAGLNQRKAASKWGYNNHYKLADISNANYNSFAFSGFEDQVTYSGTTHFGGEITNGQLRIDAATETINASPVLVTPHTGRYMAKVPVNIQGPKFNTEQFETGRTYIAKIWVHKASSRTAALNIQLTGTTGSGNTPLSVTKTTSLPDAGNLTVGNWILMSAEITVPDNFNISGTHAMSVYVTNTSGTGNAYFDDLSFHPKDAVITGNVYNESTGQLTAQLDNENLATLYNYDEAGRMISTYKEYSGGIKKVTESKYHFAKP